MQELGTTFRKTSSVKNKKRQVENRVRNEDITVSVLGMLLTIWKLAVDSGITRTSVQSILKSHCFLPYNENDFDRHFR